MAKSQTQISTNLLSDLYAQDTKPANSRISLVISLGIHGLLFVVFYFFFKYAPPNPPLPDYGVELNFGIDEEGFGELQTLAPANDNPNDAAPGTPEPEVVTPEPVPPTPSVAPAVVNDDVVTTTEESPVEIPEKKIAKPAKEIAVEKPVEKPAPPRIVENPKPVAPAPKADDGGLGRSGITSSTAGNNNGDRPGKVATKAVRKARLTAETYMAPLVRGMAQVMAPLLIWPAGFGTSAQTKPMQALRRAK